MGRIKKDRERIFSIAVRDEMGNWTGDSRWFEIHYGGAGSNVLMFCVNVNAFHEYIPSEILSCFGLYEVLTGGRHQQLANVYDLVHIKMPRRYDAETSLQFDEFLEHIS